MQRLLTRANMSACASLGRQLPLATVPASTTLLNTQSNPLSYQQKRYIHNPLRFRQPAMRKSPNNKERHRLRMKKMIEKRNARRVPVDEMPAPISGPITHLPVDKCESWVFNYEQEPTSIISLDRNVWLQPMRKDLIHRLVVWFQAMKRQDQWSSDGGSTDVVTAIFADITTSLLSGHRT